MRATERSGFGKSFFFSTYTGAGKCVYKINEGNLREIQGWKMRSQDELNSKGINGSLNRGLNEKEWNSKKKIIIKRIKISKRWKSWKLTNNELLLVKFYIKKKKWMKVQAGKYKEKMEVKWRKKSKKTDS